mmetsp:Transcript_15459/g.42874  ORF Transcript_15459/g.42874 Transcript_15459/m.42874 type:complete len:137 (-) Transcript_15459:411-821(-)
MFTRFDLIEEEQQLLKFNQTINVDRESKDSSTQFSLYAGYFSFKPCNSADSSKTVETFVGKDLDCFASGLEIILGPLNSSKPITNPVPIAVVVAMSNLRVTKPPSTIPAAAPAIVAFHGSFVVVPLTSENKDSAAA